MFTIDHTLPAVLLLVIAAVQSAWAQDSKTPLPPSEKTPLSVTEQVLEAKVREAESNSGLSQTERD